MTTVNKRVRDKYSNVIQAGDYIDYPMRQGSDTFSRTAKVIKIVEKESEEEGSYFALKVVTCIPPRNEERKLNPDWRNNIKLVPNTIRAFHRSVVVPKSYIQNDHRYRTLLEV